MRAATRVLGAFVVVATMLEVVLLIAGRGIDTGERYGPRGMFLVGGVAIVALGTILMRGHPRNVVGWIFGAAGLLMVIQSVADEYATNTLLGTSDLPAGLFIGWFGNWLWAPAVALLSVFAPLRFPTGKNLSPRWRGFERIAIVLAALSCAGVALAPGPLENFTDRVNNPFGLELLGTGDVEARVLLPLGFCMLGAFVSIVARFGKSRGIERQQMKWFIVGIVGVLAAMIVGNAFLAIVWPSTTDLVEVGTGLALLFIPVTMSVAILRYRLYDIDVVINRTLVYTVLTAILGGVYAAIVAGVGSLVGDSNLTVAAATLAVAGLFRPVQTRVQGFIDQRFYRRKYDAAQTIDEFARRLREEVELETLRSDLLGVVSQTVQPSHASLWLRAPT